MLHLAMDDDTSAVLEDPVGGGPLTAHNNPPFIDGPAALGASSRARAFNSVPEWVSGLPVQWAANAASPSGVRAALTGSDYTFSCWFRPMFGGLYSFSRIIVTFENVTNPLSFGTLWVQDERFVRWSADGWDTSWAVGEHWVWDEWNHVVIRKHGGLVDYWMNGVEYEHALQFEPNFSAYAAACGTYLSSDSGYSEAVALQTNFAGGITDVRLYDTALTDAQVLALYAGQDPETVGSTDPAVVNPAADLVADLDGDAAETLVLVKDETLFAGPERATRGGVPDLAVFIQEGAGVVEPYVNDRFDFFRHSLQVLVRSDCGGFEAGEAVARALLLRLHRSQPTGYVTVLSQQAGPTYLGEDDKRRSRWSINVEAWRKG